MSFRQTYDICVRPPDGGTLTLTTDFGEDYAPTWSPDGSQMAFTSDRGGDLEIYVMNADGTNQRRLIH